MIEAKILATDPDGAASCPRDAQPLADVVIRILTLGGTWTRVVAPNLGVTRRNDPSGFEVGASRFKRGR